MNWALPCCWWSRTYARRWTSRIAATCSRRAGSPPPAAPNSCATTRRCVPPTSAVDRHREEEKMRKTPGALELTKQIVRMNTVNPPGDEEACARYLGAMLEAAGFGVAYHKMDDKRANLVARIGGRADKAPLCFTGHIDTVPLGAARWSKDPFSGETDAGRLYGRGTSDMKCGVAAFVVAAMNLGRRLERSPGLELVITAGEETGCQGAFDLVSKGALHRAGAVVVGEPTSNYPLVGHKGAFWLRARTRGVTAHGSMPE